MIILPRLIYPLDNGYVNDLKPTIQGTGKPGASISGNIDSQPFSTTVSENGVWYYKSEIDLNDLTEHTVNLTQTSSEGQVSPEITAKFRTDTKMFFPHSVNYPENNQLINTNSPTISGSGKPGATIEMNLQDSVYNTVVKSNGNWEIKSETLPEGSSFMYVVQKDLGNVSPAICSSFTVDTIAPSEPVVDFPYDQCFINNPKPVLSGKGEPNAFVDLIVDEKNYTTFVNSQGNWSFEISEALIDDTHIISARQKDLAGNISPETINIFTIKTVQPAPPIITNPVSGSIISMANPVLSGQGESDCVVVTRIYDKIYSSSVNNDRTWDIKVSDKLNDGNHTIKIYQVDKAGNISSSLDLTLRVDTTVPPAPEVIYPQKGKYVNKPNFIVKGTGQPDAVVTCTLAGEEYSTKVTNDGSWSIDLSNHNNIKYKMNYILIVKQTNLAGNTGKTTKIDFFLDKDILKAPDITFPKDQMSINTASPTINGTGKPGATINLVLNSKEYTTKVSSNNAWSITIGEKLLQGENTLTISQTDCGNVSPTTTVNFNVKLTVPPCPIILSPTKNQIIENQSVTIMGRGEIGSTINIKLDDASFSTNVDELGNWEYTTSELLQGIHSILVNQTDAAGNISLFSQVNFILQLKQPLVNYSNGPTSYQIVFNPPGPELTTKTIATLKTTNPITINNVFGNEFSMIIPSNGLYEFNYTDIEGNNGKLTAAVSWLDCQPPIILIDSSGNWFSSNKTVNYYKYGGSKIKNALINSEPFESGINVSEEGSYKLEITDTAGNIATACFIIDRSSPEVSGVEDNMIYNNDVTIFFSDNLSGIKSAMLNETNILPGIVLSENGEYTLTVTDNADNITERTFSIQKLN